MCIHVREMKKEERSKQGQVNNKAKQHSTPKAVTFPCTVQVPIGQLSSTLSAMHYNDTTKF